MKTENSNKQISEPEKKTDSEKLRDVLSTLENVRKGLSGVAVIAIVFYMFLPEGFLWKSFSIGLFSGCIISALLISGLIPKNEEK